MIIDFGLVFLSNMCAKSTNFWHYLIHFDYGLFYILYEDTKKGIHLTKI